MHRIEYGSQENGDLPGAHMLRTRTYREGTNVAAVCPSPLHSIAIAACVHPVFAVRWWARRAVRDHSKLLPPLAGIIPNGARVYVCRRV